MKKASLIALAAIIVVANALALAHAFRNRHVATPEAKVTLTQRELRYLNHSATDDSGVTLQLAWMDPNNSPWADLVENPAIWLDQPRLERLGFDCSVNPSNPDAERYYQRQQPRQVFIALEYEGAAWRAWWEAYERAVAAQTGKMRFNLLAGKRVVPQPFDRYRCGSQSPQVAGALSRSRSLYYLAGGGRSDTSAVPIPGNETRS